jgi:hypothetical protein
LKFLTGSHAFVDPEDQVLNGTETVDKNAHLIDHNQKGEEQVEPLHMREANQTYQLAEGGPTTDKNHAVGLLQFVSP